MTKTNQAQPADAGPVDCPVRRAVACVSGWRYAVGNWASALTWHTCDRRGKSYRCQCSPRLFRVGKSTRGPSTTAKKKFRLGWKRRPGMAGFFEWLNAPNARVQPGTPAQPE